MRNIPDISKAQQTLSAAFERFDRLVAKAADRPTVRRRLERRPLPSARAAAHRPSRHPVTVPVRYRGRTARTFLERLRAKEEKLRGSNPVVAAARRAAGRVGDAVRRSLNAVRRGLRRLGGRPQRGF